MSCLFSPVAHVINFICVFVPVVVTLNYVRLGVLVIYNVLHYLQDVSLMGKDNINGLSV